MYASTSVTSNGRRPKAREWSCEVRPQLDSIDLIMPILLARQNNFEEPPKISFALSSFSNFVQVEVILKNRRIKISATNPILKKI